MLCFYRNLAFGFAFLTIKGYYFIWFYLNFFDCANVAFFFMFRNYLKSRFS